MNAAKTKPNAKRNERRAVVSAQQTIPYVAMHPDGVCQLPGGLYTKTVEYEDINYAVASTEDQTAIFGGWSSFLNYFDSSLPFQLSFVNRRSRSANRYKVNIPEQEDEFNSIRHEYVEWAARWQRGRGPAPAGPCGGGCHGQPQTVGGAVPALGWP